ncbi:hypothetical protein BDV96DRAFT_604506 [Lophiotrema nucula]|uniref:Uncharacterized protein n=1 Tax=Lophiotrema nucula TaxID=690887 RepID=A0A6A5YTZ7_9PLEO|nr:hypothetical protein BDV96DRAFT_604506 [Lophiotrema nucula]
MARFTVLSSQVRTFKPLETCGNTVLDLEPSGDSISVLAQVCFRRLCPIETSQGMLETLRIEYWVAFAEHYFCSTCPLNFEWWRRGQVQKTVRKLERHSRAGVELLSTKNIVSSVHNTMPISKRSHRERRTFAKTGAPTYTASASVISKCRHKHEELAILRVAAFAVQSSRDRTQTCCLCYRGIYEC